MSTIQINTSIKSIFITHLKRFKALYFKYERRISPIGFVIGFIADNLTLTRIDLYLDNLILFGYFTLASAGIMIVNLRASGRLRMQFFEHAAPWFPILIQYAFGGLFSGFMVFYLRSASLAASWPFLLLLLLLIIGNEFFKERYLRLGFHMSVLFLSLFSFAIFFVPVVVGRIGAMIFLLSGAVSLVVIALFIYLLFYFTPDRIRASMRFLMWTIGSIFIVINVFYFTNILPPIPLALKAVGVYHLVVPIAGGGYTVSAEKQQWYEFYKSYDDEFQQYNGEAVYFYSAVFAPTDLKTNILHRWQYFNEVKGEWIETDRLRFPIIGGRDGGWRGYSVKESISPGLWRVSVITDRGQVLGRVKFDVVTAVGMPSVIVEQL